MTVNLVENWFIRWVAILTFLPFIPLFLVFLIKFPPLPLLIGICAGMSLQTSIVLSIIAVKQKVKWVLLWWFLFLGTAPFGNVIFWFLYLRGPKTVEATS